MTAEQLTKTYDVTGTKVTALCDVSLSVPKGQFLSIMGPSGSGKSTFLHLIGGIENPTSGEVFLAGSRLSGMSEKELTLLRRRRVGFIFQSFNLIPTLTAEENIALPLLADGRRLKSIQSDLDNALERVDLGRRRHHRPDQMSGGEQQRTAVARALIADPDLILADEPTGNLDSKTGAEVLSLMREASSRFQETVILVTHDPGAAAFSDRVVFLADGAILDEMELGPEIDASPIIERLERHTS